MSIRVLRGFSGYPGGTEDSYRTFTEGEEVDGLPAEFEALVIANRQAEASSAAAPAAAPAALVADEAVHDEATQ